MFNKAIAMKKAWDFQRSLKKKIVVGKSTNNKVQIIANAAQEVQKVQLDSEYMKTVDRKELEKAIKEALNNLNSEMKKIMKDEMPNIGDILGG
jgi:DNA-binding protein YbaB